jgi:mono/diheme cytochrome c family protein
MSVLRSGLAAMTLLAALVVACPVDAADYATMSGEQLYRRFCAACHGVQGRGDGPVADAFTVEVPDLTLIARRAGGQFPRDRVARIIDGRHILGAHGSRAMPVWGEDLSRLERGNPEAETMTRTVIERLADYLEQLQRPPAR